MMVFYLKLDINTTENLLLTLYKSDVGNFISLKKSYVHSHHLHSISGFTKLLGCIVIQSLDVELIWFKFYAFPCPFVHPTIVKMELTILLVYTTFLG